MHREAHAESGNDSAEIGSFSTRHIGQSEHEVAQLLETIGFDNLDALIDAAVPKNIRLQGELDLPTGASEAEALAELRIISLKNKVYRSFLGAGYYGSFTPPVIQRNILENPGWYTAYTPYQAELAQGRLEALVNFQTMVTDLTGMEIANASLLDEATAAAEAMTLCHAVSSSRKTFLVADNCHPQTIEVIETRAKPLGFTVRVENFSRFSFSNDVFGILLQYPATDGAIHDYHDCIKAAHDAGALAVVAADILALTLLKSPAEMGADVAVGSTQRFGVPIGFGGPHAAYFATRDEFKRHMPGRLVGVSHDAEGRNSYRLALQTREQHIRRDKATSNICTAQVLLAVMASMYAVYHGPKGLAAIARRINRAAQTLAAGFKELGLTISSDHFFDTVSFNTPDAAEKLIRSASERGINLRATGDRVVTVSLDETTTHNDLRKIFEAASSAYGSSKQIDLSKLAAEIPAESKIENRKSKFLEHPIFNTHDTETELLRYMRKLESRDLSLCHSMIPLGSCTMKLNATAEMFPVSWPEFAAIHPFAPADQTQGCTEMCEQLEEWLAEITGFSAVSLQPNAGSQGEYAGLLAIRGYHQSREPGHRTVCLIPTSAHGTNPASAVMAGFKVVSVACLKDGDIDLADLRAKADQHAADLGALMVTYPSTHGVFEPTIREICEIVHSHGGQVYLDGANMNAQVGLCRPGDYGADVCHLNLHKTFCIPHGGGGPGVGPIGVAAHLIPFLPAKSTLSGKAHGEPTGPIAAAPYGSASILTISWMYIRMMGRRGLTKASEIAILNANYIAKRLDPYFPVLFKGAKGLVAHECIVDLRQWKSAGIEVEDVAKRLMDYGFHAPTVSWPVAGTMMIEPTESEAKGELDRFCDAMIAIHGEIKEIADGKADRKDNLLKNAPHTARQIAVSDWKHPYSRERAAFPAPWTHEAKFWPSSARIDNVYGDRNLFCSCPPVEDF
jgi:glycine dehydrogenase